MTRLMSKLLSLNSDKTIKTQVYTPANTEELRIPFRAEKTAKVVGRLAQIPPPKHHDTDKEQLISGVLVQNDFKLSLMAPDDLREYAGLSTTTIMCKQRITLSAAGISLIKWALEGTFGSIEEVGPEAKGASNGGPESNGNGIGHDGEAADEEIQRQLRSTTFLVMGCVRVHYQSSGEVMVEWEGNTLNDGIADAVMAVLFTVETSPAAVKRKVGLFPLTIVLTRCREESSKLHSHDHSQPRRNPHADITPEERFDRLCMFLEAQFGPSLTPILKPKLSSAAIKTQDSRTDGSKVKKEPADETMGIEELDELEAAEVQRLHDIGIPVPGVEIKVEKYVARVWLENLDVESTSQVFAARVKAVVDRAVETVAPLWSR